MNEQGVGRHVAAAEMILSDKVPAFSDRAEAGRRLGETLADRVHGDVIVYAIPRGGVPVALEVARALEARGDVFVQMGKVASTVIA